MTLDGGVKEFTAVAIQTSALKNVPGESAPVSFVIDTEPPTVSLNQITSPSNVTTPVFSGNSSETTPVTIDIYEGSKTEEVEPVATATATPGIGDGSWTSSRATPALLKGLRTFTAVAHEPSGIGNKAGKSAPVTFVVDTLAPTVTLHAVAAEGDAKPSFSGTASESAPVTIDVYAGAMAGGTAVASLTAEGDGEEWISGQLPEVLENGTYTAVASQQSKLGNEPGTSKPVTFIVNTSPPTVVVDTPGTIKTSQAVLQASVDPNNGNVSSCSFEFGTSSSYGRLIECAFSLPSDSECTFSSCVFPSGTGGVSVYAKIFELQPSTTYFYRVVAENERGPGSDVGSFTTPARSSGSSSSPPPAPTGTAATGVAASKSAGLAALLASQLDPSGRGAKIAALLRAGLYRARFKAPEPGTTSIRWYYLPRGAKLGGKGKHAPVLVASGTWKFSAAGVATIKIRLSAKGRLLLSHAKQIRLTATCTFTPPPGSKPTAVSRTFELKR